MKTFIFPGQGSQAKGMGGSLFDEFPELTQKADKILGYSIKELCLEDPRQELNQTQFTQPALYVVNALSYYKKLKETDQKPDYVAGHSLGEFNALLAAECFDFEAGLKLVRKRGLLMSQATDGGMAAIVNGSKEEIESILEKNGLTNVDLANFNTPSQIVISGHKEEVVNAKPFIQAAKFLYFPLKTSGAFHSRFMEPSRKEFETYLKKFKILPLNIPVISNVTARPYENGKVVSNLSAQITSSVRWSESIQYLLGLGDMEFEEMGHGKVLTKLVHKIRKESDIPVASEEKPSQATQEPAAKPKTEPKPKAAKTKQDGKEKQSITVQEKVNAWNKTHPIGTKVKSDLIEDDNLETRTEAVVLFGHRAAVYMKGYNGYFDLDEISPK